MTREAVTMAEAGSNRPDPLDGLSLLSRFTALIHWLFIGSNFLPFCEIPPVRDCTSRMADTQTLSAARSITGRSYFNLSFTGLLLFLFVATVLSAVDSGIVAGQAIDEKTPAGTTPAKRASSPQEIQALIEKLGANQFQEREQASAALLEIGEPALLPLSTAERGNDAEICSRAKAIRERIERDRFEAISLSFKRDPDPTASYGLPGWKSFSKVAGTSRPAKRLFLKMLDDRSIVALCLESLEGGKVPDGVFDGLPEDPQKRLRAVVGKACTDIRQNVLRAGKSAETGDLITMLIVVQLIEEPPLEIHETARLLCNTGALNRMMLMPGAAPSARKIMGGWFVKVPVAYGSEVLNWANLHRIPEARQMALRMLDSTLDAESKADALMSLSQFGLPEDLPAIDKFIDNPEVVFEFNSTSFMGEVQVDAQGPPNNGAPVPRQMRFNFQQTLGDIALLAGCKIGGLDLEKIFPVIRVTDGNIVLKNSIGFPVDKPGIRVEKVKLYREFRAKNPRPAS